MKKILSLFLALVLVLPICPVFELPAASANTEFAGGSGTAADPYLIATKSHLNNVRYHLTAHYKMIADIVFTEADFSGNGAFYNNNAGWNPIGADSNNSFAGVFNGNNFTIKNITNTSTFLKTNVSTTNRVYYTYIGLFGYNKGTILNLKVSNAKITTQLNSIQNNGVTGYVGIICAKNEGTVTNCNVSGKICATENYIAPETIRTQVRSYVGGIAGDNSRTILNCHSEAQVQGYYAGGILGGENRIGAKIDSCYNLGIVSGSSCAGGICGGVNYGEIQKCYNSGTIDGDYYVAGIATHNDSRIINCFNSGKLKGESMVGGIVAAWNTGNISCCYNIGDISSTYSFGGILVPSPNSQSGTVTNSYYLDNIPEEVGSGRKEGIRYSYEQMQNKDSYKGFDFNTVWTMGGNEYYSFPELIGVELVFALGDVDGVDGVSLNDAIYLLYHVNFKDTYPVNQPVDFDGNGKEDLDDAIYLLYHVNFKDTYPLH